MNKFIACVAGVASVMAVNDPNCVNVVLDVRESFEIKASGKIACAETLQVQKLKEKIWGPTIKGMTKDNKKARIVVYCASGGRAASAVTVLKAEGYENAVNGGGYES